MILSHDAMLAYLLYGIEKGEVKITMRPNQDTWMGDIIYDIENGWKIIIFSDCFCWDYIDSILDEDDNIIYKYSEDSFISNYQCPDQVAKEIYKIFDPSLENENQQSEELKEVHDTTENQ